MIDEKCRVVEHINLGKNYFLLKVRGKSISKAAKPGNFAMIRILSEALVPLLRRPLGILKAQSPHIWFYYEVVGAGTRLLTKLKKGDEVVILGPLGNSFPEYSNKRMLLVAGGRGIVPLLSLARHSGGNNQVYLLYGAKSRGDLNLLEELGQMSLKERFLLTEDGSIGQKGMVTEYLIKLINRHHIDLTFTCGPKAMNLKVAEILNGVKGEHFVSLEAIMGCGFGICHSCVVKTKDKKYAKVCSEGPIFRLEEIDWQTFQ